MGYAVFLNTCTLLSWMYIWTLALDAEEYVEPDILKTLRLCLSDEEKARAERFKFPQDRNRFIVAHALCRYMLSEYGLHSPSEWVFDKESLGRPFVKKAQDPEGLEFNLTHTPGMVGCALALGRRIGIDLESRERHVDAVALAEKNFSRIEADVVINTPAHSQQKKFFEYWTLKEAYIKVTGKGLTESLDCFSFDLSGEAPVCSASGAKLANYQFGQFEVAASYQGAWALESNVQVPLKPEYRQLKLEELVEKL